MTTLTIEVHPLQYCPALPSNVSRLYRECNRPLPSWYLSTSLCNNFSGSEGRLSEVFETSLLTSAKIRSLLELYGHSRSALPFVFGLIRVLIHACSKEATINTDARFVRPRRLPVAEDALDGIATMLVCHLVANAQHEDPSPMDAVEAELELADSSDSMSVDADSEQYSRLESSNSPPSIDLPLEAHVLPGCGRHHSVALPLLCSAGSDTITDLMCSVACQRHVWGIREPVVGFLFSSSGVSATLVLSWVDPATHVVHVVRPADDPPHSTPGRAMFDFTSPTSVLRFAHLILNLSSNFATISEHTIASCKNNGLDWRADTIEMPSEKSGTDLDTRRRNVSLFPLQFGSYCILSALSTSLPSTASLTPALTPMLNHTESPDKEMAPQMTPNASLTPPGDDQPAKKAKPPKSYKSSSVYVGVGQIDKADTLTWLFDRHVVLGTRLPTTSEMPDIKEYHAMLGVYDEVCGYQWSSALTPVRFTLSHKFLILFSPQESCTVDGSLNDVRDLLFQQAAEMAGDEPDLKLDHVQFLQKHMSALLYSSIGTFTQRARDKHPFGANINEADARHDWDAMLYNFYVTAGEIVSPCVLLERTIKFARNRLVDSTSLVEDHKQLLAANELICAAAHSAVLRLEDETEVDDYEDLKIQTRVASEQAGTFTTACKKEELHINKLKLQKVIEKRSRMEPRQGVCDALLFGAIDASGGIEQEAKFVRTAASSTAPPAAHKFEVAECLTSPFAVCMTEMSRFRTETRPIPTPFKGKNMLFPHAVAEYKKRTENEGKALNQGRMYLVSLVSFFSALGIEGYPFFGVVTSGKQGAVLMAWKSIVTDRTYLIERNVRKFDISIPIQAFHFATFLLRLRDDQEKLKRLVLAKLKDVDSKRVGDWTKFAQVGPDAEAEAEAA
ncbi:hypothetical protein C8R47DRAFT_990401 [Mycena vitilis]|nr:hypothetical protein C8R47DRAFT_990401 [Mycena vitilis]